MKLEFKEEYGTEDRPCLVYLKGVRVFIIYYEKFENVYWIQSDSIDFRFYPVNPKYDKDFIEPYKYSKTLEGAKKNCKHIMYSYINWLTEK